MQTRLITKMLQYSFQVDECITGATSAMTSDSELISAHCRDLSARRDMTSTKALDLVHVVGHSVTEAHLDRASREETNEEFLTRYRVLLNQTLGVQEVRHVAEAPPDVEAPAKYPRPAPRRWGGREE